jgi:hypothetical protein
VDTGIGYETGLCLVRFLSRQLKDLGTYDLCVKGGLQSFFFSMSHGKDVLRRTMKRKPMVSAVLRFVL